MPVITPNTKVFCPRGRGKGYTPGYSRVNPTDLGLSKGGEPDDHQRPDRTWVHGGAWRAVTWADALLETVAEVACVRIAV